MTRKVLAFFIGGLLIAGVCGALLNQAIRDHYTLPPKTAAAPARTYPTEPHFAGNYGYIPIDADPTNPELVRPESIPVVLNAYAKKHPDVRITPYAVTDHLVQVFGCSCPCSQ